MKYELNDNKISTLMHVNALLKREKQTERIEDARELLISELRDGFEVDLETMQSFIEDIREKFIKEKA